MTEKQIKTGKNKKIKRVRHSRVLPLCGPGTEALNTPARASLFFTLGNIISRAAAFIFTPILTRVMTPADYGSYSLFNSLLSLLTVIGTLELCGSVFYRALQRFSAHRERLLAYAEIFVLASVTLTFSAFILIRRLARAEEPFVGCYILLYISVLSTSVINLFSSKCRYEYKYKSVLGLSMLGSVFSPFAAVTVAVLAPISAEYIVTAKIAVSAAVALLAAIPLTVYIIFSAKRAVIRNKNNAESALPFAAKEQKPLSAPSALSYLLKLAMPMLPYYISLMAIAQADKLIIESRLGEAALGRYAVAYSAGMALSMLTGGIAQSLSPWVMRKAAAGSYKRIKGISTSALKIIAPLTLLFLSFAPEVMSFLAPGSFADGLGVVYPAALCSAPLFFSTLQTSAALSREKTLGVILSGTLPAALAVAAGYVFIPRVGIISGAVISLCAYLMLFLIGSYNLKRIFGNNLINVNKALQIILFSSVFAAALYLFRGELAIRAVAAILCAIALGIGIFRSRHHFRETKE